MIRKLQLKFVAVCMTMVTIILAVVFMAVYISAQHSIQRNSQEVLERVLQEASSLIPGISMRPGLNFNNKDVHLPYFTVQVWENKAYVTSGTYADMEDTDALRSILGACLAREEDQGTLEQYGMRYLRRSGALTTHVAFVDMSMEQATLRSMMRSYLMIGCAALLLLLGVSILLSRWATRPVDKAWKQQRQFLSDASHELKTPLTVILSNAELMESAGLEERPARWADNIHSEAQRMKTLVEEMLTLARADSMERTTVFSRISLSEIAMDCILLFEPVAFEVGKHLEYSIRKDLAVNGDGDSLKRLISILLDNAIKYGADGGIIRLNADLTDRGVRLEVSNENGGKAIPPEVLPHLFERFYRADESRGEQSGFGLGLSIAASIAADHKGALRAESDTESTRFILTLPATK
ncbi:MAG: HAMP domain-containing histidine kinase [Ruminococcaceae bacterium]|nr:HAMP domain-containing histidine kinase [Oscillospiraceae bacterium]